MKLIKLINPENVSEQEANEYQIREAARAIVFDADKKVALIYSEKYNYYKLPGGGVEGGEDYKTAVKRECAEEIGCEVTVGNELGMIMGYRKKINTKQTSYCYLADVLGEKGQPKLTQSEIEEAFVTVWLPLEEAVRKVRENINTSVYLVPYMVTRDTAFLEEAANYKL